MKSKIYIHRIRTDKFMISLDKETNSVLFNREKGIHYLLCFKSSLSAFIKEYYSPHTLSQFKDYLKRLSK